MIKKDDMRDFSDSEYCEMHEQDANICEEMDDNSDTSDFIGCRDFRYQMYIRGDLPESIVNAAKAHFQAESN